MGIGTATISFRLPVWVRTRILQIAKDYSITPGTLMRDLASAMAESEYSEVSALLAAAKEVHSQIERAQELLEDERKMYARLKEDYIDTKAKNTAYMMKISFDKERKAGESKVLFGLTQEGLAEVVN